MGKTLASRAAKGDTTIYIGPNAEDPEQSFRYVKMHQGVTKRCHFDKDCMAQQSFIDAGRGKGAIDACEADDTCHPLIVTRFSATSTGPPSTARARLQSCTALASPR